MNKPYPEEYLGIQLSFAKKADGLLGIGLYEALRQYTSIGRMCNIPYSQSDNDPTWEKIAQAVNAENLLQATYAIYLSRFSIPFPKGERLTSGVFQTTPPNNDGLFQIHLRSQVEGIKDPFSPSNLSERKSELKDNISQVISKYGSLASVGGGFSWVIGPLKTSGIFPPEFYANAISKPWYRSSALWGQFLNGNNEVPQHRVDDFYAKLNTCVRPDDLPKCFRYPVLEARASIDNFCAHLGIQRD